MCDFDLYIEQYKSGLITRRELVTKLETILESEPKFEPFPVTQFAQTNLDKLKDFVQNDCACHWAFFCKNCPASELDSFCNVNFLRGELQTRDFVLKYI